MLRLRRSGVSFFQPLRAGRKCAARLALDRESAIGPRSIHNVAAFAGELRTAQ